MFYLIGSGINGYGSMPIEGINACKVSDYVYLERYTNIISDYDLLMLEKLVGKKIIELSRIDLETGFEKNVLPKAGDKTVSLIIVGDPLSATTHIEFLKECKEKRIKYKVIHASSIYSSLCETGMFVYKFGKSASIPYPEKNYNPTSFFDIIENNFKNNAHTIVFLDIKKDLEKYMSINEGLGILLRISKEKKSFLDKNTEIIGVSRMGYDDQIIKFGKIKDLIEFDFKNKPQILIVPKLSEIEREYVSFLYGK
ncbi:MAG: diphthine synthase [Candidatus Nanoarchaeia archaeon]|jgi:diphthine synthase